MPLLKNIKLGQNVAVFVYDQSIIDHDLIPLTKGDKVVATVVSNQPGGYVTLGFEVDVCARYGIGWHPRHRDKTATYVDDIDSYMYCYAVNGHTSCELATNKLDQKCVECGGWLSHIVFVNGKEAICVVCEVFRTLS